MGDYDVLDKVRRAREHAAAVATGLKDTVTDRVADAQERLASGAADAKELLASGAADARELLASGAADFREAAMGRTRELLDDFNATLPALREAGYVLTEVSVSIGIPPTIVASFHASDGVTEETVARVMEEHKDRKLAIFLMRALFQAQKFQTGFAIAGMKPRGIAIEIGLTPGVVVKFA